MTIDNINALSKNEFIARIGPLFEGSPWIAEAAWNFRPFANRDALLAALFHVVESAGEAPLLDLIRAHPDLVGRLARAGQLTRESTGEQTAAGLLDLDPATIARFENLNTAYRTKFGFPFVICARLNDAATILAAFESRLERSPSEETCAAWGEIRIIAALRLDDVLAGQEAPSPRPQASR